MIEAQSKLFIILINQLRTKANLPEITPSQFSDYLSDELENTPAYDWMTEE